MDACIIFICICVYAIVWECERERMRVRMCEGPYVHKGVHLSCVCVGDSKVKRSVLGLALTIQMRDRSFCWRPDDVFTHCGIFSLPTHYHIHLWDGEFRRKIFPMWVVSPRIMWMILCKRLDVRSVSASLVLFAGGWRRCWSLCGDPSSVIWILSAWSRRPLLMLWIRKKAFLHSYM